MSGGEPSSIKQFALCDAVSPARLYVGLIFWIYAARPLPFYFRDFSGMRTAHIQRQGGFFPRAYPIKNQVEE